MKDATPLLRAYLAFSAVAEPLYRQVQARRLRAGKELPQRRDERFGRTPAARPDGRLIWFHAASVGESLSLLGLLDRLLDRDPDLGILVTTGTVTSAALLADLLPPRAIHQFAPYDAAPSVRRFLAHWRPDVAVWTESELWPRLLHETSRREIPMLLLNTRISGRTAARWRRFPRLARALLSPFREIQVQEPALAALMRDLGVAKDRVAVTGSLKEELPPPLAKPEELASLTEALEGRRRWLAASTHEGEETVLVAAHERAFARKSGAPLLIVAPRHPDRGPGLASALTDQGWTVALRSRGERPGPQTAIYIADTMGEMGLWYRLCPTAFVGGSLVPLGGHNPYEPAQLGCAVIHGPEVFNFAGIYQRLDNAGGAVPAGDEKQIADALLRLQDSDAHARVTEAARGVLASGSSATAAAHAAIERALTG